MRKGNAMLDTTVTYPCAEGVEALFLCTGWCSRGRGAYLNFIEHVVHGILISLYRFIQRLLALVRAACSDKAALWKDHGLVFPSTIGTPLSHHNVVRSFKALLGRAGLPAGTRLYDLRHTCATLLLNSNVHPKYVQELLGHASIAQTLDTYSHVLEGIDSGIGDAMDAAVG
jgi:integrase